jgi:hypothetical protein
MIDQLRHQHPVAKLCNLLNVTKSSYQAWSAGKVVPPRKLEDNVFQLPSWVDPQLVIGNPSKSDWIEMASIGINVDKKYANQVLLFNANVTDTKFSTFSFLDYDSTAYNAA